MHRLHARVVRQLLPARLDYRAALDMASRRLRFILEKEGREKRMDWMLVHAVEQMLPEAQGARLVISAEQTAHLNRLNNALHPLGQQLVDEARRIHAEMRAATARGEGFAQDYELEVRVAFFAPPNFGDPIYEARTLSIRPDDAEPIIVDPTDWKPWHTYPDLDRPYCYLLHDLLDHSPLSLERVCEVEEVWGEVEVWERWFVKVV